MSFGTSSYVGIAAGERGFTCAEVSVNGERRTVKRTAVFVFPDELSMEKPAALGQALAMFLREKKFSSSKVVVGLPAKWLITVQRDVPPSAEAAACSMLRLQAERLAAAESADLVFDFLGHTDTAKPTKVLLAATLRARMEQIESTLEAAGLNVQAITSSALTLAKAAGEADGDLPLLVIGSQGAELVWRHEGVPRMLRHVTVPGMSAGNGAGIGALGAELGRAVAIGPAMGNGKAQELVLMEGTGLSKSQLLELSSRLRMGVKEGGNREMLKLDGDSAAMDGSGESYGPAIALALAGADRAMLPLDFRKSRLTPARRKKVSRQGAWGIALGAAAVLTIAVLYILTAMKQSELDDLTGQLDGMQADVKKAELLVERMKVGRTFFESRPPMLECLRDVTLCIKDEDQLWVTAFSIKDDHEGTISGKARDRNYVLAVMKRMQANKAFSKVTSSTRLAGGQSRDMTFSISFNYTPVE